jgi:hypothetical protein
MNTNKMFNKARPGSAVSSTPLDSLLGNIQRELNGAGISFASKAVAGAAMSLEGIDSTVAMDLQSSVQSLSTALESIASAHGVGIEMSFAQKQAATCAGIIAGDIPGYLHAPVKHEVAAMEGFSYIGTNNVGGDAFDGRMKEALEAYDEKENKNAITYSIAYNMQSARQDAFGEAFYPTIVITPDQVGFGVSIRLISVYNEVRREISGNVNDFGKRNIIQAIIDPDILRNDQLKIVPVYRTESAQHFVAPADVVPFATLVEGETVTTAPLAMGKNFSLLGISQTEALLETGLQDSTDSIDTAVVLAAIYMRCGGEVVKFNTNRLPLSTFIGIQQGNYRQMKLAFETESLQINKFTKLNDKSASVHLAPIVTGEYSVRIGVKVSGTTNLEIGTTNVWSSNVDVSRITDKDGTVLSPASGQGKVIHDLFADAVMIGFDIDAQRTNLNRRMRGQMLDTTFYNQVYAVPLRSPVTIPRPMTLGDANDSTDLAALITVTRIRTSNAAVDELLRVEELLSEYINSKDSMNDSPEILGIARKLIKPFYSHELLEVDKLVDSIKSAERANDIQALIVNKLRDKAYRMYRDSGYKAAADALAGGIAQIPTVLIGCDPVLAQYLMISGDFRTLGNDFNVKIVSTLNKRMAGRIMMTFGQNTDSSDGVPNPMHFGNMAWKPELTLVLPLHRNGGNSKELTVQPSFIHITNLPILASFTVTGIEDIIASKAAINLHQI